MFRPKETLRKMQFSEWENAAGNLTSILTSVDECTPNPQMPPLNIHSLESTKHPALNMRHGLCFPGHSQKHLHLQEFNVLQRRPARSNMTPKQMTWEGKERKSSEILPRRFSEVETLMPHKRSKWYKGYGTLTMQSFDGLCTAYLCHCHNNNNMVSQDY